MEVILLDQNLNVLGMPIDGFQSLIWKNAWTECGSFKLYLNGEYFQDVKSARYVFQTGENDTAIIEGIGYSDGSGSEDFYAKGRHLNALLCDCVIPKTETLRGNLETKIRALVKKYAIDDSTQKVPKLQLGELQGYTESIDTQITGEELSVALYSLLNPRGMSWELKYDFENDVIYFNILKGKDRTQDQTENTWATFSTSRENIRSTEYSYDDSDYKNYAYVAGEGEGNNRTVVEVDQSNGEKVRALYVDARDLQPDKEELPDIDKFFVCGSGGMIYVSNNSGATWSQENSGVSTGLRRILFVNGQYLICGDEGVLLTSTGNGEWTPLQSGTTESLLFADYKDGIFVISGNGRTLKFSYDMRTWTSAIWASGNAYSFQAITHDANRFYGCGLNGHIHYSYDGIMWYIAYTDPNRGQLTGIACGNGIVVAVGRYGTVVYSNDLGRNWNSTNVSDADFRYVAYGNKMFVAVGSSGVLYTSTDGEHWTLRNSHVSHDLYSVTYGDGRFIAQSYYNTQNWLSVSNDGVTWISSNPAVSGAPWNIVFGESPYKYALRLRGLKKLEDYQKVDQVTGAVDLSAIPVYGKDYQLGDICDFVNHKLGLNYQDRVISVESVYEAGERSVTPYFGTAFLDVRNFIKREANK